MVLDNWVVILLVILGIWFIGARLLYESDQKRKWKESNREHFVRLGTYIGGFPHWDKAESGVICEVTEQDFVFTSGDLHWGLGAIPRDSINDILLEGDFSLVFDWDDEAGQRQRTSFVYDQMGSENDRDEAFLKLRKYVKKKVQRLAPEENIDNSCLADVDSSSDKENEFWRILLRAYERHQKVQRLTPEEKKCPYCAEVIKKEAMICRFCRSNL